MMMKMKMIEELSFVEMFYRVKYQQPIWVDFPNVKFWYLQCMSAFVTVLQTYGSLNDMQDEGDRLWCYLHQKISWFEFAMNSENLSRICSYNINYPVM